MVRTASVPKIHLYALSARANELFVFTVRPTSYTQVPGLPYTIANPAFVAVLPEWQCDGRRRLPPPYRVSSRFSGLLVSEWPETPRPINGLLRIS
jgi:hypothetical protein